MHYELFCTFASDMRKFVCFLLATMMVAPCFSRESSTKGRLLPEGRKKVAVVLSGGGAKGVAHIGALKVIEKAGLPVDIITGTSMGSLVGGLYAIGYDANSLDSLVRSLDWNYLLSDRENLHRQSIADRRRQNTYILSRGLTFGKRNSSDGGFITGKNIELLLEKLCNGYTDSLDFNRLPIPFACVATDLANFTEVDFHSGRLPQAMRASMSIPAAFSPVRIDSMVLVDGGMRNNFPADIAKQMGADIIIGVTVTDASKKAEDLNSTISILAQIVDVNTKNKLEENIALTDLRIAVDPKSYSAASFNTAAIDTLLRWGEEEAMRHWDDLVALRSKIGIGDDFRPKRLMPRRPAVMTEKVRVSGIVFENMTAQDEHFLRGKFHLDELDSIDVKGEELLTTSMRLDLFYQTATSRLVEGADGYQLVLTAGHRKSSQVNLGFRFDNEEIVAMQLNANLPLKRTLYFSSDLTLRLGKRILAGGDVMIHPSSLRFSRPVLSYYFRHNDIGVYYSGDREYNILYNQHQASVDPINFSFRNFDIRAGVRWDYFHFGDMLLSESSRSVSFDHGHYFSYRASLNFDSEDNWYFPTRGARFKAAYAYVTDNFASLDGKAGLSDVSASWRKSFLLGTRFAFQPMLYGRLLFGSVLPQIYGNIMGGYTFGHYVEQQLPFIGIGHIEYAERHFAAVQLQGQQRVGMNHYVLLRTVVAQHAEDLENLFKTKSLLGVQAAYYYNTMFGPLGAAVSYSNRTKTPYFYINLGYEF